MFTDFITIPLASFILASGGGGCAASKPLLSFQPTISKIKFNTSTSAGNLTQLHSGRGSGVVLGLAADALYYEYQSRYKVTQQGDKICVSLDKIQVKFRARPVVFVSKEFPRGSCEFKAVLIHEKKHVNALRKVHSKYAPRLKKKLRDIIDQIRPMRVSTQSQAQAAQKKMEEKIQKKVDDYLSNVRLVLDKEQNKIDSPTEYERVHAKCDNWTKRLRI